MKILKTLYLFISLSAISYSALALYQFLQKERSKAGIKKAISSLSDKELRELLESMIKA